MASLSGGLVDKIDWFVPGFAYRQMEKEKRQRDVKFRRYSKTDRKTALLHFNKS